LQRNAIAAARAAGVTHVVKVSAFAASDHSNAPIGRWHYQVEKELQASGTSVITLNPAIRDRVKSGHSEWAEDVIVFTLPRCRFARPGVAR
jgi:uncharacterized protein YbjT (DUF2867 family)